MYLCPCCNKDKHWKMNEAVWDDVAKEYKYKHKWKFNKRLCKTCKELANESVVLSCTWCDSITMVNEEVFTKKGHNIMNWDIFEIKECPKCSPEKKFKFL